VDAVTLDEAAKLLIGGHHESSQTKSAAISASYLFSSLYFNFSKAAFF
jgi:hypothetical protein